MNTPIERRSFLKSMSILGVGGWTGLSTITPGNGLGMVVDDRAVRFRPDIEPVVRWIEDTPREKIVDVAVAKMKEGLAYRDLMGGLFLAGVRNIKPRPLGFKFHAVMVINSAHVLGQMATVEDRLLPMFWALDNFKNSQAQDIKEGDWTLTAVDESHVPGPGRAKETFINAMENWDADAADAATSGLCRSSGAAETMELFWRYGLRDHRNIGHKAIYTMQCWRTLQAIGWANAEPVLRSLTYGILDLQNDSNRAPAGPYVQNLERAKSIRDGWTIGREDTGAQVSMLQTLREASADDASATVAKLLNDGVSPGSLWNAVILSASEMLLQNPGIVPLHAVTAANALHYMFVASGNDETRRLALLQAAGWIPLYRQRLEASQKLALDKIEPIEPEAKGPEALAEIFRTLDSDRRRAAAQTLGFLKAGGSADELFALGRAMIFHKGRDSHDYKYGAAIWEEFLLSDQPEARAAIAASTMARLPSAGTADSPLIKHAREVSSQILGTRVQG